MIGGTAEMRNCLSNALPSVPADIAGYFAATRGVANQHGVFEVQMVDDSRQVVSIAIHVIPSNGLS